MSFKKNKYVSTKTMLLTKTLALFLYNYFHMKRHVCKIPVVFDRYISPYETLLGGYEGSEDQIPHTYSHYSDIAMETLLHKLNL
jgi:hypothetical protein